MGHEQDQSEGVQKRQEIPFEEVAAFHFCCCFSMPSFFSMQDGMTLIAKNG